MKKPFKMRFLIHQKHSAVINGRRKMTKEIEINNVEVLKEIRRKQCINIARLTAENSKLKDLIRSLYSDYCEDMLDKISLSVLSEENNR